MSTSFEHSTRQDRQLLGNQELWLGISDMEFGKPNSTTELQAVNVSSQNCHLIQGRNRQRHHRGVTYVKYERA